MRAIETLEKKPFQTQAGLVYERLWGMISTGEMMPGESLSLRCVARLVGTSIAPARDALALLSERGVVEKVPRFGYRVRGLTREDIVGYFTIRRALLAESARLAAKRITDEQITELSELAVELDQFISADDYDDAGPLDDAFHRMIADIAGVPKLVEEIARLEMPAVFLPPRHQESHPHLHVEVVDAIATRDPVRADQDMRAHVDWAFHDTLESLQRLQRPNVTPESKPSTNR